MMNKWKETLSILTIGTCFIAIILLIQPNEKKVEDFNTRIPKTTTEHILFNTSFLLKKLVFNELFLHRDEILVQKIKELVSKETKPESNLTDLNIDFLAPLELIRFTLNEKSYTALKFRILNSDKFDQHQKQFKKSLLFRDKLNGFWVLGELKNRKSLMQKFISNNSFDYRLKNNESNHYISKFRNSKLLTLSSIQINGSSIRIEQKTFQSTETHTCLKPKGLHFSTNLGSSQLESLKNNKVSDYIHLNELKYVSINYLGLYFIDDSKIQAIPKFEVLLTYSNKIVGDSVLSVLIRNYNLPFEKISKEVFQLGDEFIKIKQMDTNQFIISTLNENFELNKTQLNPTIIGDPKNIVKISNAGWKSLFLELIPGFKASKSFLETTHKISTYRNKKGSQVICLSFKKNEDALHSLLKLALNFQ